MIFYDREGITDQDFNGGRFAGDGEKADRSKKQRIKIQKSDNKIGAKTRRAADTNGAAHMSRNGKVFSVRGKSEQALFSVGCENGVLYAGARFRVQRVHEIFKPAVFRLSSGHNHE